MIFDTRYSAGQALVPHLEAYRDAKETLVVGLARGGVEVAFEVAKALHCPLELIVLRKIGAPHSKELAIGAIAESGEGVFNEELIQTLQVSQEYIKREVMLETRIAKARSERYRQKRPPLSVKNQTVILVDDGIATGATMAVAVGAMKKMHAKKVVVAVPVASVEAMQQIKPTVDQFIALQTPADFMAVGQFYRHFPQVEDEEVISLLGDVVT